MKKIIIPLIMFAIALPFISALGDNWLLYFSGGMDRMNATDFCLSNGVCMSNVSSVGIPYSSYQCSGTDQLYNVSFSGGVLSGKCSAQGGGIGSGNTSTEMRNAVNISSYYIFNVDWANILNKPTIINGTNGVSVASATVLGNYSLNVTLTNGTQFISGSIRGATGNSGSDGAPGSNGANGINGSNGANGINGTNGANGLNGTNGTLINSSFQCTGSDQMYNVSLVSGALTGVCSAQGTAAAGGNTSTEMRNAVNISSYYLFLSPYALVTSLTSVGNWTNDKPNYATTARVDLVNATAENAHADVASVGNWSAERSAYWNTTHIQVGLNNGTGNSNLTLAQVTTSNGNYSLENNTLMHTTNYSIWFNQNLNTTNAPTFDNLTLTGALTLNTAQTKPTCSVTYRGMLWTQQDYSGTEDVVWSCLRNSTSAYNWVMIARGG